MTRQALPWLLVAVLACACAGMWLTRKSLEAVCSPSLYAEWDWSCQVRLR